VKSCRAIRRGKRQRVRCTLRRSAAVRRVRIKVTRRGRTFARGTKRPSRRGVVTFKPRRRLRRGTYRVTLTLRDARGNSRRLKTRLRVRR
jgi:hypothetical protein